MTSTASTSTTRQFAFADNRATWPTTRPLWIDFLTELGDRLHADGRTLSVSVPHIADTERTESSGYWVYDYGGMEPHVDQIRIMAYDYSTDKAGPIAPLAFVREAIAAAKDAVDDDSKLVLGVALYGYNWPIATVGTCPAEQEGKTSVSQRNIDELLAKRSATPVFDPVTGESTFTYPLEVTDGTTTCTQTREVHYVDAEGARQRIDLARTRTARRRLVVGTRFRLPCDVAKHRVVGPHPGLDHHNGWRHHDHLRRDVPS